MNHEQLPNTEINAYFSMLGARLTDVPELRASLEFAVANSEYVSDVFTGYVNLIGHVASLDGTTRKTIRDAKAVMLAHDGNFGTASQVSADDLSNELGNQPSTLRTLADQSTDANSPYFAPAVDELVRRLEGGHQLKMAGKHPSDDDAESRTIIWGHTIITDSKALVHFMISHHLERFMAVGLVDHGSELAKGKDFMLNALVDVLLVDQLNEKKFDTIYRVWATPKDQGGLGWVKQDRIASYAHQIN